MKAALGLDFGTESVRALLVDLRGRELASVVAKYPHGQITESLPGSKKKLPAHYALQHPLDWIDSAAKATRTALRQAKPTADEVLGIGVDFTSCTMLPVKRDGTPLCVLKEFDILGIRSRPSPFNIMHSKEIETFRNPNLVCQR